MICTTSLLLLIGLVGYLINQGPPIDRGLRAGGRRRWYPDRPPGHQPAPVPCGQLVVSPGGFILYDGQVWDVDYDWQAYARQHPGAVPRIILDLTAKR